MHKPLIPLTLAYLAGLLLGHGFLYFPFTIITLVLLGILTAGVLTWLKRLSLPRFLLIVLPCLIGMAAYLYSAAWLPSDHYTRLFPADKTIYEMTGRIASGLDRDPDRTGFEVDLETIDRTAVKGRLRVSVREATSVIGYGDTIRFSGKLFEPRGFNNPGSFDYAAYLAQSGIYHLVSIKQEASIQVLKRGSGAFRTIQDWRERIRQSFLASTTGPGSAILQAMTLGEEGRLTDEMRDQFMAAGVTHIISISGSHLGMVAILCFGLIRGLLFLMPERHYHRLTLYAEPKKIAAWCTLPLVLLYTLLAGGQVATVRSLAMITAGLAALILDREHALAHSLALAALAILAISPQAIFDISFQLSFISVMVIAIVVSLWNSLPIKADTRFHRFGKSVLLLIIISLCTALATGPLVSHYFNQFSFAGIISNLVVVPFAGMVVVPLGLASGLLSLVTGHLPFAWLNQSLSTLFVEVVVFFSRLPFAEFHPPAPGILWLTAYAVFLVCSVFSVRARLLAHYEPLSSTTRPPQGTVLGTALSGAVLVLLAIPLFLPIRHSRVTFFDVGQGDSALIELASGKTILIDGGGTRDNRFDLGHRVLAPILWNKGIRALDLVILSHPHPDHMNGLPYLLRAFRVAEVWDSGLDRDLEGYAVFDKTIQEQGIRHSAVSADTPTVRLGNAELSVLHPSPRFRTRARQAYSAENDRSLVIRITAEGKTLLFTGDAGTGAEAGMVRSGKDLHADLIKVPHHGSKSSSSEAFLERVRPTFAIMTAGKGNPYRHPAPVVVERYKHAGARICRTDLCGMIRFDIDQDGLHPEFWNDLALKRIERGTLTGWWKEELTNGKRLWIRAAL